MSKKVFIAYAHQDEGLCEQLKTHLAPLQRAGLISIFRMRDIEPGSDWENEIDTNLNQAEVILLLISPDFIASDYCYTIEMKQAIERHKAQKACVIPIILRLCNWEATPIGILQVLPQDSRPVTDSDRHNLDEAFYNIAKGIEKLIQNKSGEIMQHVSGRIAEIPTGATTNEASNRISPSPSLASPRQSQVQPAQFQRSEDNPYARKNPSFQRRTRIIFLGILLIGCLILGGTVAAVSLIRGGSSHLGQGAKTATTTAQTHPGGTVTPIEASSYDAAVAKSGIQFGFNAQHTRTNPYESTLNPDNVWKLQKKWAYLIGSNIDSSPPAVANGLVYVGAQDGKLYAFDAATGDQPKWVASTGGAIDSSPAVVNGFVYVGSQDGNLYAFDAATGQKKGVASVGNSTSSSPTIANGLIYIGSDNGNLYAFDAAIAAQSNWVPKWVASTNPSTRTGQRGIASSPAVANGLIYVSSRDGNLYAFDAATGHQQWVASTKGVIDSSPAVANGFVYVGSQDGKLYAFNAIGGQPKWSALTGAIHDSSPAVANNLVYVGSWENHSLYAFDAATGHQQWVTSMGDAIYSSPVVANGLVYVGSFDGKLYAFDAAIGGQPKWSAFASSAPGKKGIDSSPAVVNGLVYVGSQDGRLYAFSLP
jgi:outer membrane protein assembly factor BamB